MTRWVHFLVTAFVAAGPCISLEAASLKVAPARFIVHNVRPGVPYDIYRETGLRLAVFNDDDATHTWVLSTHRPSERGRWETGYSEIPDARWCWFDRSEITVPPQGKAYAHLFLKVPDEEKYYNQHWVVTLGISAKPGRTGISLAADIRAQIETAGKMNLKERPAGPLGLEPSMVRFDHAAAGSTSETRVVLYNNDDTTHTYEMRSLFEATRADPTSYLTQSFAAIPNSRWIRRDNQIRIGPGGSALLSLGLEIPRDATHLPEKWEDILLIQPDNGLAGFVRVQARTGLKTRPD